MAKNWGFLLKVWWLDENGKEEEAGKVEAEGLSPFKSVSGAKSDVMDSEKFDHITNAMALGNFISKIGDKNALTIKKVRCPLSSVFEQARSEGSVFQGIYLSVTPLAAISSRLKGEPRIQALEKNSLELVMLFKVGVPYTWTVWEAKANRPTVVYDYISLEINGGIERYFKGKDYK